MPDIAPDLSGHAEGTTAARSTRRVGAHGAVERLLSLNVNGQLRRVDVLPQETLAMTLRYKLGLTGTKLSCDRAECGACSTLTHSVRSRKVLTIEGIRGPNGELHPVQQAFVDELSPQCSFCTPGQVMAAVALLQQNPKPTRGEARLRQSRRNQPLDCHGPRDRRRPWRLSTSARTSVPKA